MTEGESYRIGNPPSPPTQPVQQSQPPRRPRWPVIVAAVAAVLALVAGGIAVGKAITPSSPSGTISSPNPAAPPVTQPSVEPAKASYGTPTAKDFTLDLKILKKECFGSAGCNVTFRIELTQVSSIELDPDKTYELTYEVRGGEDPLTNTMEITGDQYQRDDREHIGTKSSKSVLKVVITSLTER